MELSILQIVFITLIAYLKMTDTVTTQLFAFIRLSAAGSPVWLWEIRQQG